MWLLIAGALTLVIVWYALWGRAWLKAKPWAWSRAFFALVEPIEIFLWRKSETLLVARFLMIVGMIPPILEQFEELKPLFDGIAPYLPTNWQAYISLAFTVIGVIGEIQRRYTTKPLALVEVPETSPVSPSVNAALVTAEIAKEQAVAVVAEAKKEEALLK